MSNYNHRMAEIFLRIENRTSIRITQLLEWSMAMAVK